MSAEIAEVSIPDNVPGEVRSWLSEAANALVGAYADDLDALILFGSAAEGRMRASSAARVPHGLTVIVERDGHYPDFASLIQQLARARAALAAGRRRRRAEDPPAAAA